MSLADSAAHGRPAAGIPLRVAAWLVVEASHGIGLEVCCQLLAAGLIARRTSCFRNATRPGAAAKSRDRTDRRHTGAVSSADQLAEPDRYRLQARHRHPKRTVNGRWVCCLKDINDRGFLRRHRTLAERERP